MVGKSLLQLAQQFFLNRAVFEAELRTPVLLWEAPGPTPSAVASSALGADEAFWERTSTGSGIRSAPTPTGPVAFMVEKLPTKANAFALGVTVGRVATNDIVVDDESVSRFHAFLQRDEKKGTWSLSDADSRNGTFCDEVRAQGTQRLPLVDGGSVRFGRVGMRFMLPTTFIKWLEEQSKKT
jgi:hypothetical protein